MTNKRLVLDSVLRVLDCPKVHVAAGALISTYFAVRCVAADLPPTQRASLWIAFVGAVSVAMREIIIAWTSEDVARVMQNDAAPSDADASARTPPPAGPSRVAASAAASPAAILPPATGASPRAAAPLPAIATARAAEGRPRLATPSKPTNGPRPRSTSPASSAVANIRSLDMPPRTKLPLILIGLCTLGIAAIGCQTPTELSTYREGLHQVDEPLYQAHLLLLNDAVRANLRTDVDRQVVQQSVNAAEALYQQSRATEAAKIVPATQP